MSRERLYDDYRLSRVTYRALRAEKKFALAASACGRALRDYMAISKGGALAGKHITQMYRVLLRERKKRDTAREQMATAYAAMEVEKVEAAKRIQQREQKEAERAKAKRAKAKRAK